MIDDIVLFDKLLLVVINPYLMLLQELQEFYYACNMETIVLMFLGLIVKLFLRDTQLVTKINI